jgi:hypothetical protein
MSLKHFIKGFEIDADSLENSDLIIQAQKVMGKRLYTMANRVFREYTESRDEAVSGGYFKFAMVLGDSAFSSKHDVDYLWERMGQLYGTNKASSDFIKRVLGTICMLAVARDPRPWAYKDDPDKKKKVADDEIPDATEYFIMRR